MEWTESPARVATCARRMQPVSRRGVVASGLVAALALLGASASTAGATGVGRAHTASPSPGDKVDLVISNSQFCRQAPCQWPTEAAYARGLSGPLAGTDNPNKFVGVSPGDTVTWTYEDTASGGPASCDFYGTPPYPSDEGVVCPGHTVSLEDGSSLGKTVGFLAARSGRITLTWVVPAEAKPGLVIRYFCNIRDMYAAVPGGNPHWLYGMTGGLKVVAR